MKKITLITAASALLLASGAWASDNQSVNSAMGCASHESNGNPGQNMHALGIVGKGTKDDNPAQHVANSLNNPDGNNLGEMIQMMCSNPSPTHTGPPAP